MRPRMKGGDCVFGLSPSGRTRRVLYAAPIEECITYREAYQRFPDLRGPVGPIHVRPIQGAGPFPQSDYQHIPDSMHPDEWRADLATPDLDRFFVFREGEGWIGRGLGESGPEVEDEIVASLKPCVASGERGLLGRNTGTRKTPVAYHRLFTGLHLETDKPEVLLALCASRVTAGDLDSQLDRVLPPR